MTAPTLAFTIPGRPVPCARARVVGTNTYTPSRTRGYELHVAMVARSAMARARWRPGPDALFLIELNVFRAQRAGDWDNFAKAITDALTKAGAWRDDRYIEDARVRLFVDREYPRVDVLVQELVGCAHCRRVWACVGKACPEHEAAS